MGRARVWNASPRPKPRTGPASKVALLAAIALAACGPAGDQGDQRTDSLDPRAGGELRQAMPPEAVVRLDSGNAAFRADDFPAARAHYRAVVELVPDAPAGWFGLYLAEQALGNAEEAEQALQRAREAAPGRSLIHPESGGS